MSQFVILSGPSCIGKSPLHHALKRFYPDVAKQLQKLVLYNDRDPRPGEREGVDYHFRSREEVEALGEKDSFVVLPVRNDLQALNMDDIHSILDQDKIAFFEGNPYLVNTLRESGLFDEILTTTIFLSPLCKDEIKEIQENCQNIDMEAFVTDVMRKKQLRRKQKQMGLLSIPDLEDVEIRCKAAYSEMRYACNYDYVIPNHDGEDSENWTAFAYPIGDAFNTLISFVSILQDSPLPAPYIETWEENLL